MPRFSQRKSCSHISELPQAIVETTKQMRNRLLGFVAHVGEPECLAFQLSVAAVDHEVMPRSEVMHQFDDVDSAVVLHAGERDGPMPFGREKLEASGAHPIVDERTRPRVALITPRQAFGEDFFELRLQCVNVANARRRRRHVSGLLFSELEKIEVVAAICYLSRARESFFGNAEKRKTGRERERFLRAGQKNVDAECIHRDWHRGEG